MHTNLALKESGLIIVEGPFSLEYDQNRIKEVMSESENMVRV